MNHNQSWFTINKLIYGVGNYKIELTCNIKLGKSQIIFGPLGHW